MDVAPRSGPTGVWRSRHEIAEPEEFSNAVAGATLRADFLGARRTAARIERFMGGDWSLDFFEAGVTARISGPLVPGWTSLCLPFRASGSRWYGEVAEDGWLLCNPPGVAIEGTITPGFCGVSVAVPREVWEDCWSAAQGPGRSSAGFQVIRLPAPTRARILRELREVHRCLDLPSDRCRDCATPARLGAALARELVTLAGENAAATPSPRDSTRNRYRLARRAEAWMRDHLAEHPGIPELCRALGTSRRELEYAFRSAFAQSPRAFLESLRLNAVRTALVRAAPGTTVSDIALEHGFSHFGRFAARFKEMFGESPSAFTRPSRFAGSARDTFL